MFIGNVSRNRQLRAEYYLEEQFRDRDFTFLVFYFSLGGKEKVYN